MISTNTKTIIIFGESTFVYSDIIKFISSNLKVDWISFIEHDFAHWGYLKLICPIFFRNDNFEKNTYLGDQNNFLPETLCLYSFFKRENRLYLL